MSSTVDLAGSERSHPANSVQVARPALDENIQLTLVLRRKQAAPAESVSDQPISRDQLADQHGPTGDDVEAVLGFASKHRLAVRQLQVEARTVILEGPLGQLAKLFSADLQLSKVHGRVYRTRQGQLAVPEELAGRVIGILGFDQRPVAKTYYRRKEQALASASFTPVEIAQLYNFPVNTAKGQTIALIELGGGYQESDLAAYWGQLGLSNVAVESVNVDGAQNAPEGNPDGADGEVVLDIEVAGAVASGAKLAVYFGTNTDAGFLNAINAAIHDNIRRPSVISISWGAAECEWTAQSRDAFNAAFHDAALLGISICVAAGDNGSSDGERDRHNHVDFPASSPWVLACGGTHLVASQGGINSETVWNDGTAGGATGGGVSSYFPLPAYQAQAGVPKPTGSKNKTGRGVPDVAGIADPETGYRVFVDGETNVVGGTSAVAPLWAGLIALCNAELGKNLGWLNPILYRAAAQHDPLHDVIAGCNGAFRGAKGWDCCTGLGTPDGKALLDRLKLERG